MNEIQITLLGTRGSSPVFGDQYALYGGATSCALLRMAGFCILLDGGTGLHSLRDYLKPQEKELHLLLSHPHIDHIGGIAACSLFYRLSYRFHIYGRTRQGLTIKEQLHKLISPPLWPVDISALGAEISFHEIGELPFSVGDTLVTSMEGNHPGGSTIFRLSAHGKSMVYATDYEQGTKTDEALSDFARGTNLLLCDGQLAPEELETFRGFGHSTWDFAAGLGEACTAEKTLITHHAPERTDKEIQNAEKSLRERYQSCCFAEAGRCYTI